MRYILAAAVVVLAATASQPAGAVDYPWCAIYGDSVGGTNCGFTTLAQCRATISGNGGDCQPNPFYKPTPQAAPTKRKH
jgi:hypothetical protein